VTTGIGTTGVTLFDEPDAVEVPFAFVAVAVNVYAVPLLSPVTVFVPDVPAPVAPPGEAVTV
jgi:hypothetical protein